MEDLIKETTNSLLLHLDHKPGDIKFVEGTLENFITEISKINKQESETPMNDDIEKKDYLILRSSDPKSLENLVNERMTYGYIPSGSLIHGDFRSGYYQPMIYTGAKA